MAFSGFVNKICKPVGWNLADGKNAREYSTFINRSKVSILQ